MNKKIYTEDAQKLVGEFSEKLIFWKDIDSQYQDCNFAYAQNCGFEDFKQLIGLNDSIINTKYQMLYLNDDKNVIQSKAIKHLYNPAFYQAQGDVFVEGMLLPVFDRGEDIVGILGMLDIKNNVFSGSFMAVLNYIRHNNIANILNQKKYFFEHTQSICFSKNELACYIYAELLNLSSKQISNLMNLSPRTVEKYLERVREKRGEFSTKYFNQKIQELINVEGYK